MGILNIRILKEGGNMSWLGNKIKSYNLNKRLGGWDLGGVLKLINLVVLYNSIHCKAFKYYFHIIIYRANT